MGKIENTSFEINPFFEFHREVKELDQGQWKTASEKIQVEDTYTLSFMNFNFSFEWNVTYHRYSEENAKFYAADIGEFIPVGGREKPRNSAGSLAIGLSLACLEKGNSGVGIIETWYKIDRTGAYFEATQNSYLRGSSRNLYTHKNGIKYFLKGLTTGRYFGGETTSVLSSYYCMVEDIPPQYRFSVESSLKN